MPATTSTHAHPHDAQEAGGFVILTYCFRRENKRWLGECLELGTASYGRTLQQAHDELMELVELHLDCLEDVGERAHLFETHNIRYYTADTPPTEVTQRVPVDTEVFVHAHRLPISVSV